MNYEKTVSLIPEMELSYSQENGGNAQRTHIRLKAQMQPFMVNGELCETVEFSVNGEREISEMVRLLNDELGPKEKSKKEQMQEIFNEMRELERLRQQNDDEFNLFTDTLLLDKSKTERQIIDEAIEHIARMKSRLLELSKKYF